MSYKKSWNKSRKQFAKLQTINKKIFRLTSLLPPPQSANRIAQGEKPARLSCFLMAGKSAQGREKTNRKPVRHAGFCARACKKFLNLQ
nr:MAG TPA: hypothetical protein [Caudoviricetes sp.]